jgi:hypothetical protein
VSDEPTHVGDDTNSHDEDGIEDEYNGSAVIVSFTDLLSRKPPHKTPMYSWHHDASAPSAASMRPKISALLSKCIHELVPCLINASMNLCPI